MFFIINFTLIPIYYIGIRLVIANKEKALRIFTFFVSLHIILFRTLFHPYNTIDIDNYIDIYSYYSQLDGREALFSINIYSPLGHLYGILCWLFSRITDDIRFLFAFVSVVSVGGVLWFYKKSSYAILISILFYLVHPLLYYMGFGVIRQHLAVFFVLLFLYYIYTDKKILSILMLIIAFGFHTSAIVLFPYYIFRGFFSSKMFSLRNVIVFVFFVVVARLLLQTVLAYMPRFSELNQAIESENNIIPVIEIGSLLFMFYLNRVFKKITNKRDIEITSFLVYGFVLALLAVGLPGGGRLTLYHLYLLPVGITYLFKYSPSQKAISCLYLLCFAVLFAIQYYLTYTNMGFVFEEYVPIWNTIYN